MVVVVVEVWKRRESAERENREQTGGGGGGRVRNHQSINQTKRNDDGGADKSEWFRSRRRREAAEVAARGDHMTCSTVFINQTISHQQECNASLTGVIFFPFKKTEVIFLILIYMYSQIFIYKLCRLL